MNGIYLDILLNIPMQCLETKHNKSFLTLFHKIVNIGNANTTFKSKLDVIEFRNFRDLAVAKGLFQNVQQKITK